MSSTGSLSLYYNFITFLEDAKQFELVRDIRETFKFECLILYSQTVLVVTCMKLIEMMKCSFASAYKKTGRNCGCNVSGGRETVLRTVFVVLKSFMMGHSAEKV